jgi:lipopolysaccharide biosynthesis regulator YciM
MSRELEEGSRLRRVDAAISLAETQMANNDMSDAFRTVDNALRLDPTNDRLNAMMARVKPAHEGSEKTRLAGLDPNERIKEEGDNHYKNAHFEMAVQSYTRCLERISDKVTLLFLLRWKCDVSSHLSSRYFSATVLEPRP